MSTRLSAHFTLKEMVSSEYALRHGIDNMPDEDTVEQLRLLCAQILEAERMLFGGAPVQVTSGYRSPMVNLGIGGARKSQHVKGQAADHHVHGVEDEEVVRLVAQSAIPFDQLILEFPPDGWVHISRSERPRRQVLIARPGPHGTVYDPYRDPRDKIVSAV